MTTASLRVRATFDTFTLPRADSMPYMEVTSNPVPTKRNPLGAKGAGEAGIIGALPAIVNAVLDALSPLGVRSFDMPTTSARIWRAIQDATVARLAAILEACR